MVNLSQSINGERKKNQLQTQIMICEHHVNVSVVFGDSVVYVHYMMQLLCVLLLVILKTTDGVKDANFNVKDANQTLHYAWASFCNETALRSWTCEWCQDETRTTQIQAYLKDTKAGTQGFVGIDEANNRIIVAYRGSYNFANTVQDMKFWMTSFPYGDEKDLEVDHGFFLAYNSLRQDTISAVQSAKRSCKECGEVLVTGHSLGAAMATMLAGELGNSTKVRLYTFGSPRTGNEAFSNWVVQRIQGMGGSSTRMRRQLDIVPAIPPRSIGYHHVSTEVWDVHDNDYNDTFVACDGSGEDPNCGDSEEHPVFPFDLIHLKPSEHTRYMGFQGGSCIGGPKD